MNPFLRFALFVLCSIPGFSSFAQTYCSPSYSNCDALHMITNVNVGTINHSPPGATACTVHDFTAISTQIAAGVPVNMSVTTNGWIAMGVAVDFNGNGSFSDPGEILALPAYVALATCTYSFSITIPATTPNGSYRMRVYNRLANSSNGTPPDSPCGAYVYGTWDDYTLIVYHLCPTITGVSASPSKLCTSGTSTLSCSYTTFGAATVKWYNDAGVQVGTGTPFTTPTLSTTTTYYAAVDNGTCDTPRAALTVLVVPPVTAPVSVSPSDTVICEGKTVQLTVTRPTMNDSVIARQTGPYTVAKMPINGTSTNSASELLYTSAELNIAGKITEIAFFKKSTNTTFNPGSVSIYMKNTTATSVTTSASTTGYTLVYTGAWPNVGVAASTWANITLNNGFDYLGGANNLAVLIVRSNATSSPAFAPTYRGSSTAPVTRSSYYIATTPWSSGVSTMTADTTRPDMRIRYQVNPGVNWSPLTNLFKDAGLTQAVTATDTNSTVYAHPPATITYNAYSNLNGCLSTGYVSAHIQVKDTVHTTVSDSVCAGNSYTFGTQTLTAAGTYTESFQAVNACDSVVTLHFTIRPYITNTVAVTICQGQSYTFNNITYTTAQSGLKDTFSTAGCDSIVTLNLSVTPNVTPVFTLPASICAGSTAPVLPATSNNGIAGTWNPATVDNTTTGTYTFTPNAGICATTATATITVTPNVTPTFNAIAPICAGSTAPVLPTTSTNGVAGSWSPATVSNTTTGTYTFTPNAGICATTATLTVTVNPNVTPAFNAVAPICAGSVAPVLPTTSTNGVSGTWSPATVSNTTTGTYTFTPNAGLCAPTITLTVTVTPNVTPAFTLPSSICAGSTAPVLPATSNNGIAGTWNPATVSNTTTGTYTFTPNAGICATTATATITVTPNVTPAFNAVAPICAGSTAPVLPTTSTNGVAGSWSPATVSNTTTGTYTFTPNAGICATTATLTVTVNPNVTPAFNAVAPICAGSVAPVLPTTSTNGVSGSWSPATVSNTTTGTYTFTPNAGVCAPTATLTVTVTPNVTPAFTLPASICAGSTAPVLPATSNNGIAGTWNPATVSNTTTGTYTFTPNAGICATTATATITVTPNVTPAFNAVAPICAGSTAPVFPTTSTNGVAGSWSPATVSNTTSGTYTFTPNAGICATTATLTVTVNPNVTPAFNAVAPICAGSIAPVLPTTSTNGVSGSWSPATVSNTTTGTYTFTPNAGLCAPTVTLTVTVTPNVTPAFTLPASICAGSTAPVLPATSNNGVAGSWNPATVSNTTTGTYTFTPNAGICATPLTVTINVNNNATPLFAGIAPFCAGSATPSLPALSLNGIAGSWSPATVNNLLTGTYTFTPAAGLCALPASMTVTVKQPVTFTDHHTICAHQTPYTWNGISNATTGSVYTGVAANGCDSTVTLQLTVLPGATTATVDTYGCGWVWYYNTQYSQSTTLRDTFFNYLGCDSFIRTTHVVVYPNVPYTRTFDTLGCDEVLYEGRTYRNSTTLIDTFRSQLGCDSFRRVVHITVDKFELNLTVTPEDPYQGELIHLVSSANTDAYTVNSWSPPDLFHLQHNKEYMIIATGPTVVIIKGTDENGCTDTAEVRYDVKPLDYGVFVPNAFTPNGDGANDVFGPVFYMKRAYLIKVFRVFNRYGQSVYSASNTSVGEWDGVMNNGQPADIGTYHYYIEIKFVDGKEAKFKGDVTLLR